ncbi:ATP-binding cassette, subfamily B, partial [Segatella baroniae B14]
MKKIHYIKQYDSMKCGIACLQMICAYHGRTFCQDYLSNICFATTEGVSLLGIRDAAVKIGLYTISGRLTIDELSSATLPCILHWNQNHFVILYKVKKGQKFYIADPGKGLITYTMDEFKQHWIETGQGEDEKGIAMFLEPTQAFYDNTNEHETRTEKPFKFLFGYIKQYRKYFFQIILG